MPRSFAPLAAMLVLFALFGGCAARPGPELLAPLPPQAQLPGGRQVEMTVATDREPDPLHPGNFTSMRSYQMHLAQYVISIPPGHKAANIEWSPSRKVDPASSFATLAFTPLPDDYLTAHARALDEAGRDNAPGQAARFPAGPDPAGHGPAGHGPAESANPGSSTQPERSALPGAQSAQLPAALAAPKDLPGAPSVSGEQDQLEQAIPASLSSTAGTGTVGTGTVGASSTVSTAADADHAEPGLAAKQDDDGRVVVFVHGYNNTYAESVLRMAQLMTDNATPGQAILFAWPSDGHLSGYVADKDAATFARDDLARLLTTLADTPRYHDITVIAHSMGCWVTMEALRELRLTGQDRVLDRLGTVILAAPDIDLDVFRSQVAAVGHLEPPLTVLTSPDDRALEFSTRLGGGRDRLGALDVRDPRIQELASAYSVQLIDISNMAATDSLNHDRFIGAAAALKNALSPKKSANPIRKAGAYVLDAVASVLEAPGRIGRAAADRVQ